MKKPVKVKPVLAWALIIDGEIDNQMVFGRRSYALRWRKSGDYTGPIRVRITPVPAKKGK